MTSYNTRSAARKRNFAPHEDVTVSPSTTGTGTHIHPLDEVPSNPGSLESTVTPDEDEDKRPQRSPSVDSINIADEQDSLEVERHLCSLEGRTSTECLLNQSHEQKGTIEALTARMTDATKGQPKLGQPTVNHDIVGPKLPGGVVGISREGTWIAKGPWELFLVPSTNQLPTVREFGEEERVEDLPPNNVTQQDRIPNSNPRVGNPRRRGLTPLPSFVSGNPS